MSNKSLIIAFITLVVIISVAVGTWLGLRSRQAPTSSSPAITGQPSTQESYLPSREYVEARAKAFKQLRDEQIRRQYGNVK